MSNVVAPGAGTSLAAAQLPDGSSAFKQLLIDTAGADAMGTADASPSANTLLGRLKAIATALTDAAAGLPKIVAALVDTAIGLPGVVTAVGNTASADRVVAITASDTAALNPIPKALLVLTDGNLAVKGTDTAVVVLPVKAGQLLPLRARYIMATGTTTATVAALI